MDDMPCPRFIRQGTAEAFGRAPACFTERVKKRGHRLPGVHKKDCEASQSFSIAETGFMIGIDLP